MYIFIGGLSYVKLALYIDKLRAMTATHPHKNLASRYDLSLNFRYVTEQYLELFS